MDIPPLVYNIVWPILYSSLIFFIISIHRQKYLYTKSQLIFLFWLGIALNLSWVVTYFQYDNFLGSLFILTFMILISLVTLLFIPFQKDWVMAINFLIYVLYSGWLIFAMVLLITNQNKKEITEAPVSSTEAPVSSTEAPVSSTKAPVSSTEAPVSSNVQNESINDNEAVVANVEQPAEKILHWVDNCTQCGDDLNFCTTADNDILTTAEFNTYVQGSTLSVWGCDNVNYPETPIVRYNNSVYVVENT